MKTKTKKPARTVTVATRIAPELKKGLAALAKDADRSEAYIVAQAIADYVEMNAREVKEIRKRFAEAKAGRPGVPHEEVRKWVESWGTARERPIPKPRA